MSITRILGIAPYEGMQNQMIQMAAAMPDVELTAFVGDMEPGAAIASRYTDRDIDVIISRGGTAELIRQKTKLPVVEIELSMYDILRSIRLAEGSNSRYAVVGFPAITRNADFLCDMLQYDVDIHTIHNEEEARVTLQKLAQEACSMVLCDMVTKSLAHEYGIPALLITSGNESVESALRQAVSISRIFLPQREHARMLESVLSARQSITVVLDEKGEQVFSTVSEPLPHGVMRRMQGCHATVMTEGSKRAVLTVKDVQYMMTGKRIAAGNRSYAAFNVQCSSARPALEKHGIRFMDRESVTEHFLNGFHGASQRATAPLCDKYAAATAPLMILGEPGNDMAHTAYLIYSRSPLQHAPLCVVDCALLQKKGLDYLLGNDTSPLTDLGVTVLFTHVESLEEENFLVLFRTIRDTGFKQRNRLMFTYTLHGSEGLSPRGRRLMDWFGCMVLELPPLREHREDIPHLTSLYLSLLNMRNAREIVGVEPEAMRLLEEYRWPANDDQFKCVLREAAMLTTTPYIQTEHIQRVLNREARMYPEHKDETPADALRGKTLEEIDLMALKLALNEAGGNQRITAQRLGISRTTLWRMLQKAESEQQEKG